jgi:Crinkler effector protein N-terminal domain
MIETSALRVKFFLSNSDKCHSAVGTSTQPQATTSRIAFAHNPAATMFDDTARTLWCLVEGDSTVFEVTASANASINRLKELVREKGINVSERAILAKDLVLLKVSPF